MNLFQTTFSIFVLLLFGNTTIIQAQDLNDNGTTHTINANGTTQNTGSAQDYIIPANSSYNSISFTVRGGDGGYAKAGADCQSNGGAGATATATFWIGTGDYNLNPGGTIRFIVGKHGTNSSVGGTSSCRGAGGGGTAVLYKTPNGSIFNYLIVASGGGGAYQGNIGGFCVDSQQGQGGQAESNGAGGGGEGNGAGSGGTAGYGGAQGNSGPGGGGWYSAGGGGDAAGQAGHPDGGAGGNTENPGGWGYGGGGGGSEQGTGGAPGGGGHSGGGGGGEVDNGGGGGSIVQPILAFNGNITEGGKGEGNSQNGYVNYTFRNTVIVWTGAEDHNWHDYRNWSPARVPDSNDVVDINAAANAPYISPTAPANAKSIRVLSGGELTIQPNATLNLHPYNTNGISNFGVLINDNGTINISPRGGDNDEGIENSGGIFINKPGGEINIEGMDRNGIWNISDGNFTNEDGGTINIGTASGQIGNNGVQNNSDCFFFNSGLLNIRNTNNRGIRNTGNFSNNSSGNIFIDQTAFNGLTNFSTFENSGTITVGSIETVQGDGINNSGTFNNLSNGIVIVKNAESVGIYSYDGTFTNEGLIKIGENGSIGTSHAIHNGQGPNPVFLNIGCNATIYIFDKNILDHGNNFTNSGTIIKESAGNSNIEINNGLILFNEGTFTADNGNAPISVSGSLSGKKIWTGCDGIAWEASVNWYPSGTPTASDEVVIYPVGDDPHIGDPAQAKSVRLRNGGHLFNDGSLAVTDGDLIIDLGATVEGNGQYALSGHFTVNGGTFIPDQSTVTMTGTADLKGIGLDPVTFYDLVIDKPSDKVVNILADVTVTNNLYINSGDLNIYGVINGAITCPQLILTAGSDLLNAGSLTLTVGDFTIESGATAQGNGLYNIGGSFVAYDGAFTPGTSTVTLNGMPTQRIFPDPVNFYNLTIDKASGFVALDADISVSNNLAMLNGHLDLNGADIELTGNGAIIGEDADSYIYSSSGGVVKKTVNLNAPMGVNPGNIGASITSSANLGSTIIQRGHEVVIIGGETSIRRYYDISPDNNTGLNATVRYHYLDHELNGNEESGLIPVRFNNMNWEGYPASARDAGENWVETTSVNAFSTWTLVAGDPCDPNWAIGDNIPPVALCQQVEEEVDQSQLINSQQQSFSPLIGQSFTAGADGYLTRIRFNLATFLHSDNVTIAPTLEVRAGEGLNGNLLSVAPIPVSATENNPQQWIETIFPVPASLNAGNLYSFVLHINASSSQSSDATASLRRGIGDPYPSGVMISPDGTIVASVDLVFETFVSPTPPLSVQLDANGSGQLLASDVDNASYDNCSSELDLALSPMSFNCADVGAPVEVTLTVFDESGNSGSCSTLVTVLDEVAPTAICQDVTVQLDADNLGGLTAEEVDNGSDDACGIASLSLSKTSFNCTDVGIQVQTLTVIDNNGNSASCTTNITVVENSTIYYEDQDGDGYTTGATQTACSLSAGYRPASELVNTTDIDCNDTDANVNPNPDCSGTTRTWTGYVSTDWEEACNWSPNCVPSATDEVIIPDVTNDPQIAGTTAALAKKVTVQTGAQLTVIAGGSLAITADVDYALTNQGRVINGGSIIIDAMTVSFARGIFNTGLFSNEAGADIYFEQIAGISSSGIYNTSTFYNSGLITVQSALFNSIGITNVGTFNHRIGGQIIVYQAGGGIHNLADGTFNSDGIINLGLESITFHGLLNEGLFDSYSGTVLTIDNTDGSGIYNQNNTSVFRNRGEIRIGSNGTISQSGIYNGAASTFTNEINGTIYIDNTLDNSFGWGIHLSSDGQFTNRGKIHIGSNGPIANNGINSLGTFLNVAGGLITIDRAFRGIYTQGQPFTNNGDIIIGEAAPMTSEAIWTIGTILNAPCATIEVLSDNIIKDEGTITNAGLIIEHTSGNSNISINNGVVNNLNGGIFTVATNNEIIIEATTTTDCSAINPAFGLGTPVDLNILGVFADENATQSAGTYDLGSNIFTPGGNLPVGATVFFVKIEDSPGGCTRIVEWPVNNASITVTCYLDSDGDTFGDPANSQVFCDVCGTDYVPDNTDCDDTDADKFPGQTWYLDGDDDGYRGMAILIACERPDGYKKADELINTTDIDCNDGDPMVFMSQTWFEDMDDDGYYSGNLLISCNRPDGFKLAAELVNTTDIDCSDGDGTINPAAIEICDGIDNDCDGLIDGDDPNLVDNTPPTAICNDLTITFSGEAEIDVALDELLDYTNSFDNCGAISIIEPVDDLTFACELAGSTLPVSVTIEDGNGNQAGCTATLTFNGLPCGWTDDGGIGCQGSSSTYDANNDSYDLTAPNCVPVSPYIADQMSFAYTELCGDGEITVFISGMTGTGFAGIMMRENAEPGAPKVAISTNGINKIQKEVRVLPNYPAWPQAVLAYDQLWLRIKRTGNAFRAYASVDGTNWMPYMFYNIPMSNCVLVGLFTYSEKPNSPVSATFEEVTITGAGTALAAMPSGLIMGQSAETPPAIHVFPNPAQDVFYIDLSSYPDQPVLIQLFNNVGQAVENQRIDSMTERYQVDVSRLTPGIYNLVVTIGNTRQVERVVVAKE